MDRAQEAYFRTQAHLKFLELKEHLFQDWICEILRHRHPGTFVPVRTTQGDKGMDGYLLDGTVFACYGPREGNLTIGRTVSKMTADFSTAAEFFSSKKIPLNGWTFVYNDRQGLAAEVIAHLASMKESNPNVNFRVWSFEEIWTEISQLRLEDLERMFGQSPSDSNFDHLTFKDIVPVIEFVSRGDPPPVPDLSIPDARKLEGNRLNAVNVDHLKMGRRMTSLVEQYFSAQIDPTLPEQIAEGFRRRYRSLKRAELDPDTIFSLLWDFAGGRRFTDPQTKAAVVAVLAYFFSSCDIFENVSGT